MQKENIKIIEASPENIKVIYSLLKELSIYESLDDEFTVTEKRLHEIFFDNKSKVHANALISYYAKKPIGLLVYYYTLSTFSGKQTIYIEDIYIKSDYRRNGVGKLLFKKLANIAIENDCTKIEWKVLDWNETAQDFYKKVGGVKNKEWITFQIHTDGIKKI